MKKYIFTIFCISILFPCSKEEHASTDKENEAPNTEIQKL